jgi:pimeloyl-ACP methyl ester carboxylesterase
MSASIMKIDPQRILYLHGSDGSSRTYKAAVIRRFFPDMVVPDFTGSLEERMRQLYAIIGEAAGWTIIGSSLGGLMAAQFASQRPEQVRKLILLAPALSVPAVPGPGPILVPVVLIVGSQDKLVRPRSVVPLAERLFLQLSTRIVDDDHRLHKTADSLDWRAILQ